jgi:hypothetical protein
MIIKYQKTNSGVIAFNYSEMQLSELKNAGAKIDFLDEKSAEVLAYKAAIAAAEKAITKAADSLKKKIDAQSKADFDALIKSGVNKVVANYMVYKKAP